MSDWRTLKAVGVLEEDRNEFVETLHNRFQNQLTIQPHEQENTSLIIKCNKFEDADLLLTEEVHDTPRGNRIFFRRDSQSDLNISLRSSSSSIVEEQNIEKEKLISLKTHEKVLLYKSGYVLNLGSLTMKAKHESAESPPTLKGPKIEVLTAKNDIMDWLRNLKCKFISVPVESLDKICEDLKQEFNNRPICIEKDAITHQTPCLAVWAVEENLIGCVEDYVQNNFHNRFVEVKELGRFEFINTYQLADFKRSTERKNSLMIEEINESGVRFGYRLTFVGSIEIINVVENNLKRMINQVLCKVAELPFSVTEDFSMFLSGAEPKLRVKFEICESETPRNISDSGLCGIVNNASISLVQGKIEEQAVDVIVNSTSASLNLNAGEISKCLLAKAGPEMQKECSTKNKLEFGQVIETSGYKLPCKYVFHSLGQTYEEASSDNAKKVLCKMVTTCLTMAHDKKLSSVAFPPIGCGVLKMPADISALLIFNSIEQFLKRTNPTSLVDVKVAISESGKGGIVFQKFSDQLKKLIDNPESGWKRNCGQLIKIYGSSEEDLNKAKDKILSTKIR